MLVCLKQWYFGFVVKYTTRDLNFAILFFVGINYNLQNYFSNNVKHISPLNILEKCNSMLKHQYTHFANDVPFFSNFLELCLLRNKGLQDTKAMM